MVARPGNAEQLSACLAECSAHRRPVTFRGRGYSYGDMATNDGGAIIDLNRMNNIQSFDSITGSIVVQPGVSIGQILNRCLPHGWILPVTPGSPFVTVGGAISNNVHGKNSLSRGNFGNCVTSLSVMGPTGKIRTINRQIASREFHAVIGGAGLCGAIVEATLTLVRTPGIAIDSEIIPFSGVEEMISLFESSAATHEMTVAWLDAFSRNGRGLFERGAWLPFNGCNAISDTAPEREAGLSFRAAVGYALKPITGRWAVRLANATLYQSIRLMGGIRSRKTFPSFNFIVSGRMPDLPLIYRGGMIEIQILLSTQTAAAIRKILDTCRFYRFESWWCGIKRHSSDDFLMSFSGDGYSLSIDLPGTIRRSPSFPTFIDEIISITKAAQGRIYLAKDLVAGAAHVRALYPRISEFLSVKNELDPDEMFESDLARRLFSGHARTP